MNSLTRMASTTSILSYQTPNDFNSCRGSMTFERVEETQRRMNEEATKSASVDAASIKKESVQAPPRSVFDLFMNDIAKSQENRLFSCPKYKSNCQIVEWPQTDGKCAHITAGIGPIVDDEIVNHTSQRHGHFQTLYELPNTGESIVT